MDADQINEKYGISRDVSYTLGIRKTIAEHPMPRAETGAMREKLDNLRYDYMPALEVNEAYARVAAHGAEKYATDNWMQGLPTSQLFGSLMRHAWAWMRGEVYDNGPRGSGLKHTDHILWNAVALVYNEANLPDCDDRFPERLGEPPLPPGPDVLDD